MVRSRSRRKELASRCGVPDSNLGVFPSVGRQTLAVGAPSERPTPAAVQIPSISSRRARPRRRPCRPRHVARRRPPTACRQGCHATDRTTPGNRREYLDFLPRHRVPDSHDGIAFAAGCQMPVVGAPGDRTDATLMSGQRQNLLSRYSVPQLDLAVIRTRGQTLAVGTPRDREDFVAVPTQGHHIAAAEREAGSTTPIPGDRADRAWAGGRRGSPAGDQPGRIPSLSTPAAYWRRTDF